MFYHWKKATVNLPIRIKGNSKRTSGNSLVAQNKDMGSASQTLQTRLNYLCDAGYFLQSDSINFRMIAWLSVVQFGLKSYEESPTYSSRVWFDRDVSCAVSGFGQVLKSRSCLRPMSACGRWRQADEAPCHTREKISGTQVRGHEVLLSINHKDNKFLRF